ncbi:MAG TPA: DUF2203 domain-containing protein [Chthonomonadaceae bacterium]|nr:DUF2203 domain-containing protein [Chthonomonadaceae bacterium]
MAIFEKHFTLEEARRELPWLRRQFSRIRELLGQLQQAQMEMARIQKLIRSNGHGSGHPQFGAQIGEIQKIVSAITDKGIEIKDLQRGLIDFPHWRGEEEVFLCWLAEEADITFWHTLEGGFAGRVPLTAEEEAT